MKPMNLQPAGSAKVDLTKTDHSTEPVRGASLKERVMGVSQN